MWVSVGALGEEVLSELGPVCSHVRVRACSGGGQNQEGSWRGQQAAVSQGALPVVIERMQCAISPGVG